MRLDKKAAKSPKTIEFTQNTSNLFRFSMPEHHIHNNSLFGSITEFEFFKIVLHFELAVPFLRVNNSHCWVPSNTGHCPIYYSKNLVLFVHTCSTISQWSATKGQHKTRFRVG